HGNPYGKDSFPAHEILRRMMLALTYGAAPSIAVIQPPHLQPAIYECLDQVQARKEWLTHKRPVPWGAIVMSDNTRNFYGLNAGLVEERYMSSVLGMFRASVEEHLPMTIINDWNLNDEDLADFQLIVLPNTACMDAEQMAAIERFVHRGGGLVASLDTSLFDEFGTPRANFGLAELFGVDYQGIPKNHDQKMSEPEGIDINFAKSITPDFWERRKNIYDFKPVENSFSDSARLESYIGSDTVTFKGPAVWVQPADTTTQVTASARIRETANELPAIMARSHGQGRVVYLAAGIDSAYYNYAYPYQRIVLRDAMQWAANSAPPISVEAPMCVHATFMHQSKPGHERLVIHLFNDVNTTAQHAFPNEDVPLREEVIPIHDIQVTFNSSFPIRSVRLQPEGLELAVQRITNTEFKVVVPRLEVHAMVVCELND
ncbi:MAG: ThuA domain-containing protein, partial [Aureliella sp.]